MAWRECSVSISPYYTFLKDRNVVSVFPEFNKCSASLLLLTLGSIWVHLGLNCTVCWKTWKSKSPVEFSSVTQSCLTFCNPMNHSTPGLPVHHQLLESTQTHVHWEMPSNHLILCCPLLLPSIFPSIKVFSNESALCSRWPKYWSFSFNISLSKNPRYNPKTG